MCGSKGADKVQRKPVLVAYGITTSGEKQLISYRVVPTQRVRPEWEAFLNDLYRHGLEGKALKMVITDGNAGLHKALQTVYPYVPRQRCWVHKLRNVMAKLPVKQRDACLARSTHRLHGRDARQRPGSATTSGSTLGGQGSHGG